MERDTQYAILKKWGSHRCLRLMRMNVGAARLGNRRVRFGVPGLADICGIIAPRGRLLMIEVKSPTGKQSRAQKIMERIVTAFGGLYILARSVADVDRVLVPIVGAPDEAR